MLQIKGFTDKPCFISGTAEDVVDVKFKDGSFAGAICWSELLKILKRNQPRTQSRTTAGKQSGDS